jgi:hypothetical protein
MQMIFGSVMRRLKTFTLLIVVGLIPGAVVTVMFAWYNNNPSGFTEWGAALKEWQPWFWTCGAAECFIALQVLVSNAGGHPGVTTPADVDWSPGRVSGPEFGVHPITNNATWGGIDSEGYASGNHPSD